MTAVAFLQSPLALGGSPDSPEQFYFKSEWERPMLGKFVKGCEEAPGWVQIPTKALTWRSQDKGGHLKYQNRACAKNILVRATRFFLQETLHF